DHWLGYLNQDKAANYFPDALWQNQERLKLPGNAGGKQQQYSHDLFTEFALNFIQQHKSEPFFLYIAYTIPHVDHQVPDLAPYAAQTWPGKAREYAAMITRMDTDVGRIATLVDKLRLEHNTLILFCSDNGGPAPFQEVFQSNDPLRGHKGQLYEGGLRIPMLARWPGHIPSGRISASPWYLADIFPTLTELTGCPTRAKLDGLSVLPTLLGKDQQRSDRFLYWEQTSSGFRQAVRWKNWKAIRAGLHGPVELYDLAQDPAESKNVANLQPSVVQIIETYLETARITSDEWPVSDSTKR
ncbi:MAG: sulfatase, partial [Planctomycetaceae bacterium]|nr:sulfatase [Planctomycetaceae bacterium]